MFAILPRVIRYAAFFAKLSAAHVQVDEFDTASNCARVTVIETGFPGNEVCLEGTWVPTRIDRSDVVFETPVPQAPESPESELPDVAHKTGL